MRYLVTAIVVVAVGLALGLPARRRRGRRGGGDGAHASVFSFGLAWVFTTVGLLMRTPSAVLNGGFMVLFPLTFLSNVFVEPETLPAPLEAFVNANPISRLVTASPRPHGRVARRDGDHDRAGRGRRPDRVFAPLTTRLYRRPA